jgi:hypothetical protein
MHSYAKLTIVCNADEEMSSARGTLLENDKVVRLTKVAARTAGCHA